MSDIDARQAPVTAEEAQEIIDRWACLQDTQAPVEELLEIVAEEGFLLESPTADRRWQGHEGLQAHQELMRFFFDEEHLFRDVRIAPGAERTIAWTCLSWQARYRPAGSATSRLVKAYMEHEWELRRSERTGRPILARLTVVHFEYRSGCAPAEAVAGNPYLYPGLPVQSR